TSPRASPPSPNDECPCSRAGSATGDPSPRDPGPGGGTTASSVPPMTDVVLVEIADRVATVTLNRPEARNALRPELLRALPEAVEHAAFADTHARVGIQPGWGLTVLLPQAVGVRRARELSFTGNFLDAPTALAWGLVNHVVAHDALLPFARRLAADIASNDAA